MGYKGYDRDGREPEFAFGHGLGFGDWNYLGCDITGPTGDGTQVTLRIVLENRGTRTATETVQVYAGAANSRIARPDHWLVGFARAAADPGQRVTVDLPIPLRSLAHWDTKNHSWCLEDGSYELAIGRSSRDLRLTRPVVIGDISSQS